ncbi:helix-turn-helix domain-containing protein [Listeria fleischmannii]|uniref:helix-turn-helix domain-containing protein n=1 Tax=Listeria fleischmannii TaxID=1069827 RepID=UPI001628F8F1|nr:helix-turn-helix domain-containing protein [Listeria fleischmannii]MBC1419895.1 helix-turn-helix transcriptional regulator [Listeria fleischmannii]
MKDVLKQFRLQNGNLSEMDLARLTGLTQSTLSYANRNPIEKMTIRTLSTIARGLNRQPGEVLDELIEIEEELKSEQLEQIFNRFNFHNVEFELDELRENSKTKISMGYDETPELMKTINEETDYTAYIDISTDYVVIEK